MEPPLNFETQPGPMMPVQKSNVGKIVAAVIITAVVVGGLMYLLLGASKGASQVSVASSTPSETATPSSDPIAGWKTYSNVQYGFEFRYPENWDILVLPEGEGKNHIVRVVPHAMYLYASDPNHGGQDGVLTTFFEVSKMDNQVIETNTTVAGKNANDTGWIIDAFLELSNRHISISGNPSISIIMYDKMMNDQILSTFKFTK